MLMKRDSLLICSNRASDSETPSVAFQNGEWLTQPHAFASRVASWNSQVFDSARSVWSAWSKKNTDKIGLCVWSLEHLYLGSHVGLSWYSGDGVGALKIQVVNRCVSRLYRLGRSEAMPTEAPYLSCLDSSRVAPVTVQQWSRAWSCGGLLCYPHILVSN